MHFSLNIRHEHFGILYGLRDEQYWAAGFRIEYNHRWDPRNYDDRKLVSYIEKFKKEHVSGPMAKHLINCATENHCFAAKNLFLNRWEAPLPVSQSCNAACLGCISLQEGTGIPCTQDRIDFVPAPEEIAEVALGHIERADNPVVSFGQSYEGEPLTNWKILAEAITLIRSRTSGGTINLNTNASMPAALEILFDAGLDSIRVSLNSARSELYTRYFKPAGYSFEDVVESMEMAHSKNRFVALNYFVFPGITDESDELRAINQLQEQTRFDMIQWRNLNIDPDLYLEE